MKGMVSSSILILPVVGERRSAGSSNRLSNELWKASVLSLLFARISSFERSFFFGAFDTGVSKTGVTGTSQSNPSGSFVMLSLSFSLLDVLEILVDFFVFFVFLGDSGSTVFVFFFLLSSFDSFLDLLLDFLLDFFLAFLSNSIEPRNILGIEDRSSSFSFEEERLGVFEFFRMRGAGTESASSFPEAGVGSGAASGARIFGSIFTSWQDVSKGSSVSKEKVDGNGFAPND